MEFLNTAHELEIETIKISVRENVIPKRYRFILGEPLIDSARTINQCLKYANSIIPKTQEDYIARYKYQRRAYVEINNYLELMRIVTEILPVQQNSLEKWARMAVLEKKLIHKWMITDRERYKGL